MPDTTGDEGIDEVAYKLEDWDDEAFVEAEEALRRAGIVFRREEHDTRQNQNLRNGARGPLFL